MKKHKVQETAKNLVGLYGTKEAMRIVIEENDMYFRKCQFLNEVFLEIINLGKRKLNAKSMEQKNNSETITVPKKGKNEKAQMAKI